MRMQRGVWFPAWYLLLVAMLGILSGCQSLRDLERFAIRHHIGLTEALAVELRRSPSDSSFRYFCQVDVPALCAAIRDWTIAQIEALGGTSGISKSEVSRICQGLDEQVTAFLGRPLDYARFPYFYLGLPE